MNLTFLLCNLADLIASYYISPWLPLLLSAVSLALLLPSLWVWWSNVRLLNGSSAKTNLRSESKQLKAQWALQQLRLIGPKLCIAAISFWSGWLWHEHRDYSNTFVVVNAVVEQQNGIHLTYHYEDDPHRIAYSQTLCTAPRMPHFQPRQIIASLVLVRDQTCEHANSWTLRRTNGVPILAGGM